MIFSRVLLSLAALAATTEGFVHRNPLGVSKSVTSASSLKMVADDAKVVLVTGSSRGLGKAIATDLGKAGQKVVVNFVSEGSKESADATVEEIKAAGGDAVAIQADSKFGKSYLKFHFQNLFRLPILLLRDFRFQPR
jgi:hypothetical protein